MSHPMYFSCSLFELNGVSTVAACQLIRKPLNVQDRPIPCALLGSWDDSFLGVHEGAVREDMSRKSENLRDKSLRTFLQINVANER